MEPVNPLRIAWLGSTPLQTGGAPGVANELLQGLSRLGHQVDCFLPGAGRYLPRHLADDPNLTFVWGLQGWRDDRWYSRSRTAVYVSGMFARGFASLRLRKEVRQRHKQAPYDVLLQVSSIESLSVPRRLSPPAPLVIRPDSHQAGELRWQLKERRLAFRCQPKYVFFIVTAMMIFRTLVQRIRIRRADMLVCISSVFRDHMVRDCGFPLERTVVVTNPVKLDRFTVAERPPNDPPTVLVPARISARKGIEDVIAVSKLLLQRGVHARIRVIGGPSTWSDYTKLLDDLPPENTEYGGRISPDEMPGELERADLVWLASKYDPCPMSVLEALASGVPVVATSEVGSIEGVDRAVVQEVQPGDVPGMADAIELLLGRVLADPRQLRAKARAEAERRFATDVVCEQLSQALGQLLAGGETPPARDAEPIAAAHDA